jgi:oligogalacturonide transporter
MADVDEIVTGRRREGAFAGVMTFIRKATQAAAVALVGLLMDWGGFVPKADVQSHGAMLTVVVVMALGTWAMLGMGVVISRRFRLSRATHGVLMAEIEHLRAGHREPISPESRTIVEDLSGWSYDLLWGNNEVKA